MESDGWKGAFTLNTGARIPVIGYGTGGEGKATNEELYNAILTALGVGYRLIDTSLMYENEGTVGQAVRDSGVPREELFIVTKLWPTFSRTPEQALELSLRNLGLDYIDCYLLHWPIPLQPVAGEPYALGYAWDRTWDLGMTWNLMQQLPKSKTRAIGLCNTTTLRLQLLLSRSTTRVIPAILQVEGHPELPQNQLMEYCRSMGIHVECFAPLAQGQVENPTLVDIAEKHNVDSACIAISWGIQRGTTVLPKSMNPSRIRSNFRVVTLDEDDIEEISTLAEDGPRRIVNPRILFGIDIFDNNADSY